MAANEYPDKPDRLAYDHYVSLTPGPSMELPCSSEAKYYKCSEENERKLKGKCPIR